MEKKAWRGDLFICIVSSAQWLVFVLKSVRQRQVYRDDKVKKLQNGHTYLQKKKKKSVKTVNAASDLFSKKYM